MLIAWFLRRAFRLRRDSRQLASYRPIPAARSAVGTQKLRGAIVATLLSVWLYIINLITICKLDDFCKSFQCVDIALIYNWVFRV
jgi:hypothetical protein